MSDFKGLWKVVRSGNGRLGWIVDGSTGEKITRLIGVKLALKVTGAHNKAIEYKRSVEVYNAK